MRVLHVLDHSLPVRDGYAFRSHALISAQRDRGWHVAAVTSPKHFESSRAAWSPFDTIDSIQYYRAPPSTGPAPVLSQIRLMNRLSSRLAEVATAEQPMLVQAHSPTLNLFPATRLGRRLDIPVVYEVRASWEDAAVSMGKYGEGSLQYRIMRALETRACHAAAHVTVICQGLKDDLVSRGIPADKLTIIPNGVDVERFKPTEPDAGLSRDSGLAGKKVIAFFGSFFRWEGLHLLVEAMARLRSRRGDIVLLLGGGGDLEAELRRDVEQRGLGDCVRMPGHVPQEQMAGLYALTDVLVYPRVSSRLTEIVTPLKPLEAMAMRKTVLASDVGGHKELIQDGVTGVLFKAGDAGQLGAAIERLVDDHQERDALAVRGYEWVKAFRSWKATTLPYADLYQRLVAGAGH